MSDRQKGPTSGFTLIEVLVVIVIMGILSALAVTGMGGRFGIERARGGVLSVQAFFQQVSAEVKKNQKPYSVSIGSNGLTAYDSLDCITSHKIFQEDLDRPIQIQPTITATLGPSSISAGYAWSTASGNCIPFHVKIGENPIDSSGWVQLYNSDRPKYRGIVVKTDSDNRFRAFLSVDSGASWEAL